MLRTYLKNKVASWRSEVLTYRTIRKKPIYYYDKATCTLLRRAVEKRKFWNRIFLEHSKFYVWLVWGSLAFLGFLIYV